MLFVPWVLVKAWIMPASRILRFGSHDPQKQIPAYPEAFFKIACISKLNTAVAVTKSVHNEKLDLASIIYGRIVQIHRQKESKS